jgi:hypothetical protein
MYKYVVMTKGGGDEEAKGNDNTVRCIDTMIFKENRY